eukprot:UN05274
MAYFCCRGIREPYVRANGTPFPGFSNFEECSWQPYYNLHGKSDVDVIFWGEITKFSF